ncbi:helix-turn-helix domain-containing protein [Arthrobacter sp. TMN-50]
MNPRLERDLSVKELAEILGHHPTFVSELVRSGTYFPNAYKGGKGGSHRSPWRIPCSDVEAYRRTQPRAGQ